MDKLRDTFEQAASVVKNLPDHLQPIAFDRAVSLLLGDDRSPPEAGGAGSATAETGSERGGLDSESLVDSLPAPHVVVSGTTDQQVGWAVAQLHARGQEAVTDAVQPIMKDELSVSKPNRTTVATALRRLSPQYLIRRKRDKGGGYTYEPQDALLDLFEEDDG